MDFPELKKEQLQNQTAFDYLQGLAVYTRRHISTDADIIITIITDFLEVKFGEDIYNDDEKKNDRLEILNQLKPQLELVISSVKDLVITKKLNRLK